MRLFIAIDLPVEIKEKIKKIQEQLPEFTGKKTELENLHLTLKFLGEVDDDKIEEIRKRLKEINLRKFETELKGIGFFDNQKYGVIWVHLTNCDNLQKEIDDKLKDLFDKEKRFMSHLTIARVKKIKNKKEFLMKLNEMKILKINFLVESFELKKSVLKPEGPVYKTIEGYNLG